MLSSLLVCLVLLVLCVIFACYVRAKASSADHAKLADEINTDFEDDLFGENKDRMMENLVEWLEE